MVPNYKRPKYKEYYDKICEWPSTDEDLDMLEHIIYLEKLEEGFEKLFKEMEEEFFKYQASWFTQDMDTTIKVGEHQRIFREILNKMDEIRKEAATNE